MFLIYDDIREYSMASKKIWTLKKIPLFLNKRIDLSSLITQMSENYSLKDYKIHYPVSILLLNEDFRFLETIFKELFMDCEILSIQDIKSNKKIKNNVVCIVGTYNLYKVSNLTGLIKFLNKNDTGQSKILQG